MLDKIKQLNQLRALHKEMQQQKFTLERDGVSVTVNGSLTIESVTLSDTLDRERQQQLVAQLINDALRQAQQGMAQKMQGLGLGLGL